MTKNIVLQEVPEGRSRGERPRVQAQTLGTACGGDAGDQAGLRSKTGTEDRGNQDKDDGASVEQSPIAESYADHGRL